MKQINFDTQQQTIEYIFLNEIDLCFQSIL